MNEMSQRSELLLSSEGMEKLRNSTVLVVGTGGVGSFAVEALARTHIGHLILIDKDTVEASNINRQLPATTCTIGQEKTEVLKKRIAEINPDCKVDTYSCFYDASMDEEIRKLHPDFVLDCIDSISSKKDLISFCLKENIPFIASMGMARKKDPSRISVMEIEKTSYDPLAKNLRVWKRKNRIRDRIMVVSSDEPPMDIEKGSVLPSAIFVPASAGLMMASYAVSRLTEGK